MLTAVGSGDRPPLRRAETGLMGPAAVTASLLAIPEVKLASAGCQPVVRRCVCSHTGEIYKSQLVKHVAASGVSANADG